MMAEEKQAGGESPRHHQEKVAIVTSAKMKKSELVNQRPLRVRMSVAIESVFRG